MFKNFPPFPLILSIGFVILFWSIVTPIFEFPDEQAHVGTVEFLVKNNRLPLGDELDMTKEMQRTQEILGVNRNSLGQNNFTYHPEYRVDYSNSSYVGPYEPEIIALNTFDLRSGYVATEAARYPRLYYDGMGAFYRLVESSDILTRVFVMRLGNVILSLITAVILYKLGILLFNSHTTATLLTLLVLLQPMYSFLSAGINSDNLHNMLFAWAIYTGVLFVKNGVTLSSLIQALACIALDLYTKPQGILALPVIALSILIHIISTKNWVLINRLIVLGVACLVVGWSQLERYMGLLGTPNLSGITISSFTQFSLNQLFAQNIVWYWGVFKWLGVVLPPIHWQLANRLVALATIGLALYTYKLIKKKKLIIDPYSLLFLVGTTIFYALSIYWFDYQHFKRLGYTLGIQARYFFPTIGAHMAILIVGILSLSSSRTITRWFLASLGVFIIWMQLGGIWRLITSYYDTTTLQIFMTQASQYKPEWIKGEWWYLWIGLYLLSISYLLVAVLPIGKRERAQLK